MTVKPTLQLKLFLADERKTPAVRARNMVYPNLRACFHSYDDSRGLILRPNFNTNGLDDVLTIDGTKGRLLWMKFKGELLIPK